MIIQLISRSACSICLEVIEAGTLVEWDPRKPSVAHRTHLEVRSFEVHFTEIPPRCPYCLEYFEQVTRALVRCSRCLAYYHADCFEESKKCSVYGCTGTITFATKPVNIIRIRNVATVPPAKIEDERPNVWTPIWIILYTVCLLVYLSVK